MAIGNDEQIAVNLSATQNVSEVFGKAADAARTTREELQKLDTANKQVATGLYQQGAAAQGVAQGWTVLADAIQRAQAGEITNAEAIEQINDNVIQSTEALKANTQALEQNAQAATDTSSAQRAFSSEARIGAVLVAAVVAEVQALKKAAGDDLSPALETGANALQAMATGAVAGAVAFASMGPHAAIAGAVIGGLSGLVVALTGDLLAADPALQAVNQQLDNLADKDKTLQTLQEITGSTRAEAEAMLSLAKNSPEAAAALRDFVANREPATALQLVLKGIDVEIQEIQKHLQDLLPVGTNFGLALETALNQTVPGLGTELRLFTEIGAASRASAAQVAQDQLEIAAAGQQVVDTYSKILDKLEGFKAGTESDQLAQLANVSEANAEGFLKFADSHREVGIQAADLAEKITQEESALARLQATGKALPADVQAIRDAISQMRNELAGLVSSNQEATESTNQLASAERSLENALDSAAQRLAQLDARTGQQRLAATNSLNNARADAERTYAQAIENSEQQLASKLSDIARDTANKIEDAAQQLAKSQADIAQGLANSQADIAQGLADQVADIQQGLAQKEQDLAFSHAQDLQRANESIADARQALADKIIDINRKEIQDLRALDATTHDDLLAAKTEHEADAIQRRAFQQRLAIQQNADAAREGARSTFEDAVAQAQKQRQLADQNYQHSLDLARREAADKIAQANRTANEQLATAQRTAAQQTANAEQAYQKQVADAQQAEAQKVADAREAYAEQVENAAQAEANKLSDAERAYAERNLAIAASYKLEREAIEAAKVKAQEDYDFRIGLLQAEGKEVNALAAAYVGLGNAFRSALAATAGVGVGTGAGLGAGGGAGGTSSLGTGGGFGTEALLNGLLGSQGAQNGGSSSTHTLNEGAIVINIHDATDPRRVGEVVRDVIRRERRRS